MGVREGSLPMAVHLPGDFEPCDECKKRGICLYEYEEVRTPKGVMKRPTGRLWLVKDEGVRCVFGDNEAFIKHVVEHRVGFVPVSVGDSLQAQYESDAQEAMEASKEA